MHHCVLAPNGCIFFPINSMGMAGPTKHTYKSLKCSRSVLPDHPEPDSDTMRTAGYLPTSTKEICDPRNSTKYPTREICCNFFDIRSHSWTIYQLQQTSPPRWDPPKWNHILGLKIHRCLRTNGRVRRILDILCGRFYELHCDATEKSSTPGWELLKFTFHIPITHARVLPRSAKA